MVVTAWQCITLVDTGSQGVAVFMKLICTCVQELQYHASVLAETKHCILGAINTHTQAQTVCRSMVQPRTIHCASSIDHKKLATGICSSTLATTSRTPVALVQVEESAGHGDA